MKWTSPLLLMLLCLNLLPILLANATVDYNANTYTFTFLYVGYRTSMGFNIDMTFTQAYRTSNYWYFKTAAITELWGFNLAQSTGTNATLLITDYFASDSDQLKFSVTANTGVTTTTSIYVPSRGSPETVTGASSWNYNPTTKILTVNIVHASTVAITVSWEEYYDTTPPTYSDLTYNTTTVNTPCKFGVTWQDNVGLSGYIFSTNNTDPWLNETWTGFTSNPETVYVVEILTGYVGKTVAWKWYANDTSDNWAVTTTGTLTLTTTGSGYPSASNPSYTTTEQGKLCSFTITWTDDLGMAGSIFSCDITGSWANDTYQILSGTVAQATTYKTLPDTVGTTIHYRWYAEDTDNQWSATSIYSLTVTLTPTFITGPAINLFEVVPYVYTFDNFNVYLALGDSLAFQNDINLMVTVEVTNSTFNSTANNIYITNTGGKWDFKPVGNVNMKVWWLNGTDEIMTYVINYVKLNEVVIANNTVVQLTADTDYTLSWGCDLLISKGPILPLMFILGMVGLVSMIGGSTWFVLLVKHGEYNKAIAVALIIACIGFGLFMAWLRGG